LLNETKIKAEKATKLIFKLLAELQPSLAQQFDSILTPLMVCDCFLQSSGEHAHR